MKQIAFSFMIWFFSHAVSAQISATTNNGRKVILKDDYTWKYADGGDRTKPCETANTGNVTFKNNSSKDIFIYYATSAGSMDGTQMVKVIAKSVKTVNDIKINNAKNGVYQYKVTLEKIEGEQNLNGISGETSGNFLVEQCANKVEEIDL
jgi:hypothetical protein